MAYRYPFAGPVNNTSYRSYYANNFLYSDYGSGLPAGNLNMDGVRVRSVIAAGADWHTGATWIDIQGLGGAAFRIRVGHGSGTLGAGRNTNNGHTMIDSGDGDTVTGGICGWFDWYTCPTAPGIPSVVRTGRDIKVTVTASSSDGGSAVDTYAVQYSKDGGAWQSQVNGGTTTYTNLTPGSRYKFRAWAHNVMGNSQATITGEVLIPLAFRRFDGSSWVNTVTIRRFDGSNWVDCNTLRRFDGSVWRDLG